MRTLFTILPVFICFSCTSHVNTGMIIIDYKGNDTCIFFTHANKPLAVNRQFAILENTLTDTAMVGFGIVVPGQTGKLLYMQVNNRTDVMLYDETDKANMPKTSNICIRRYKHRNALPGKIKIGFTF